MASVIKNGKLYVDSVLQTDSVTATGNQGGCWKNYNNGVANVTTATPGATAVIKRGIAYTDGKMHIVNAVPTSASQYVDGFAVTGGAVCTVSGAFGATTIFNRGRAITGGRLHIAQATGA